MSQQTFPMTPKGFDTLKTELDDLIRNQRPHIASVIAEAREKGDLKENAEYHAAREQQGFIEAKIKLLQSRIAKAQVIDISNIPNNGKVIFGAKVTLECVESGKTMTFQIVGEDEADVAKGRLSITSPIARSVVGKECDDTVEVKTPEGVIVYDITEVDY